jgi:hypothetical protein
MAEFLSLFVPKKDTRAFRLAEISNSEAGETPIDASGKYN